MKASELVYSFIAVFPDDKPNTYSPQLKNKTKLLKFNPNTQNIVLLRK